MASRRRIPPYRWNAGAGRYVDVATGRFLPKQVEVRALDERITAGIDQVQALTSGMMRGVVTVAEWQTAVAVELRRMHTQAAALGRGGWAQMTPSDWGHVGRKLRDEYAYLRGFAEALASGTLSESQINVRVSQYVNGIWSRYWRGEMGAMQEAGMTEERRILTPAEHCADCESYAAQGWQPLGSLPEPGDGSACGHNCRCIKVYRAPDGRMVDEWMTEYDVDFTGEVA